ncbi:MAG: CopG family ribbon-helix-helix protein [Aeropyrum sp.]|nr:CopG family ribbon-helix-helix protein [Aeropyrum sp.]MCE4615753.1 CopG family ribbon-helix-helix protein [Aeropyrum sp.]
MVTVISISLPDEMLKELDMAKERLGFSSRSDLVRHAIDQLVRYSLDEGAGKFRIIIVVSDHDKSPYVDRNIVSLIHSYSENLTGLYHQLAEGGICITVAITEDKGEDWKTLVKKIRALRGVDKVITMPL